MGRYSPCELAADPEKEGKPQGEGCEEYGEQGKRKILVFHGWGTGLLVFWGYILAVFFFAVRIRETAGFPHSRASPPRGPSRPVGLTLPYQNAVDLLFCILAMFFSAVRIQETGGFPHSRASPYQNAVCQIRLQAVDLPFCILALLIAYVYIINHNDKKASVSWLKEAQMLVTEVCDDSSPGGSVKETFFD